MSIIKSLTTLIVLYFCGGIIIEVTWLVVKNISFYAYISAVTVVFWMIISIIYGWVVYGVAGVLPFIQRLYRGKSLFQWKERDNAEVTFDTTSGRRKAGEISKFQIKVLNTKLKREDKRILLDKLLVEIYPKFFAIGNPIHIPFVKEYDDSDENYTLTISYSVHKSGEYQVKVLDGIRHVRGSPITMRFDPGDLDAERTIFQKPSPCILLTSSIYSIFLVRPKDAFGNTCQVSDMDLAKFDITLANTNGQEIQYFSIFEYRFSHSGTTGDTIRCSLLFKQLGFFHVIISYNNKPIQQGTFDVVVMSPVEVKTFKEMLTQDTNWIYHEGRLLGTGSHVDKQGKGSKTYIYVGSKQLSVREYIWQFIPIKIATFRVTPLTKILILPSHNSLSSTTMSISDGIQNVTIRMDGITARRVVALFSHFITRRSGGSEGSFAAKQIFFYKRLMELQTNFRLSLSLLSIQRKDIINSTLTQTKYFSSKDWYKNFKIEFKGELGIDAGGVRREWLELLCVELFRPNPSGLFASLGNSRLVHPNPAVFRDPKWTLKHYELAGKIVGKCLFETAFGTSYKQMVNGKFSRSFLAQVVGLRPNYKHFEQDDPELYLSKIKYILENDVTDMDLTFTEEEYNKTGKLVKTVDIVSNGSKLKVKDSNKEEYLQELANYKLGTRVKDEVDAFVNGLHQLVPDELLINFDENELEILWCGESRFDIEDLKQNFLKGGWNWDVNYCKVLDWFWAAVTGFSDEEKSRLLQFTTGSSLLPHGGFESLNPKFQISLSTEYGKLPVAHTCINEICLSDNLTFEKFQKCLKTAINEGCQGFSMR